eukprot:scaffold136397_cov139-Phaeocystis_antarctica.AAC.1
MAVVNLAVVDRVDAREPSALVGVLAEDSRARARTEIRIAGETHGQVLVLDRVVQAVVRLLHKRLGRPRHRASKHAHYPCDVRSGDNGLEEQSTNKSLVPLRQFGIRWPRVALHLRLDNTVLEILR